MRRLGAIVGALIAIVPSLPLLWLYLPGRIAEAGDRRRILGRLREGDPAIDELLATRAVAHLPSYAASRRPSPGCAASRRVVSAWRISRETCIWESPTRSPIAACVSSSWKRSRRSSRSRSSRRVERRVDGQRSLDVLEARVGLAEQVGERRAVLVVGGDRLVERAHAVGAGGVARLQQLLDKCSPKRSESSAAVGARPRSSCSADSTLPIFTASSCTSRGTRSDHVWSRK